MRRFLFLLLLPVCLLAVAPHTAPRPLLNSKPLSPDDERKTFALPKGFRIDLVASEPDIVDPVAMAFDERGRLFVCEMRGYPNAGRGTGVISSGQIRLLEDKDGDGVYETSRVFAKGLRFPTGITPWKGGLLVANAPDLIYLKETGEGKLEKRVLYTGFDVANIQQLLNSLQFALDNHIHGTAGAAGGSILCKEKDGISPVVLRGRGIRFDPDAPGSLSPVSSGGQYGLSADEWGRWFTATNSQHLRHIVLPDHYLRRNPSLAVRAVTLDIPEHGAACKVFRKSPFEAWRVERTTRRAGGPDAKRFASTELVPGGFVTSACSPLVYTGDHFPREYRGSVFICDPANNVIIRDTLTPHGATFIARRGHAETEFLTSTDNWFRPVHLTLGPDGAIYVLDFYREVIETPLSLPDDIKKRVNIESRGRGRIWRIAADAKKRLPIMPTLHEASAAELVKYLGHESSWWRLTAQRLLIERRDKRAIAALVKLIDAKDTSPQGKLHAMWALSALGGLTEERLTSALGSDTPGLRENALRLAEAHLDAPAVQKAVCNLVDDPDARVRFQLAFTLGQSDACIEALAKLSQRQDNDAWTQTAILSSVRKESAGKLLAALAAKKGASLTTVRQLAGLIGAQGDQREIGKALALLGEAGKEPTPLQIALLGGLALPSATWQKPPVLLREKIEQAAAIFDQAATIAFDEKQSTDRRAEMVRLLGGGPAAPLKKVSALLSARTPPELQFAAARALSAQGGPEIASMLINAWPSAGPALRRELTEALFARQDRIGELLTALEKKRILAAHIDPARLALLRKLPDAKLRARAVKILADQAAPDRVKVVKEYQSALDLKADADKGKAVFKKNCSACHRLENVGHVVGADLLGALRNKSAEQLIIDILDPSREVDPRYLSYQVETKKGLLLTGIIASETASSLTLKRGEGVEDIVLRTALESIESTGKSLMPEGLESEIKPQDMADLIAYLLKMGRMK